MKNPFEGLFSKKYPDRAQKDHSGMKRVYAGPPKHNPLFDAVYRAPISKDPEYADGFKDAPEDDNVFEDVYMGPPDKGPDGNGSDSKPAESPEWNCSDAKAAEDPQDPVIMAVYAGPEQMSGPESFKYSEPQMLLVYAGPQQMSGPENLKYTQPQMLMAYAGPMRMDPQKGGMLVTGGFMTDHGKIETSDPLALDMNGLSVYKSCPNCGNKCAENAKFCPECGFSLKDVPVTGKENADDGKEQGRDSKVKEEQEKQS